MEDIEPTDYATNLYGVDVNVGDSVRVISEIGNQFRVNTDQRYDVSPEWELIATRVYNTSLIVRTAEPIPARNSWGRTSGEEHVSFTIDRGLLTMFDESLRQRKLGEKPEDTAEITYIGVDHPGIQWLFNDMGRYADLQGYCQQYDILCTRLGIPGRERDFTVKTKIQGVELTTTIKARSQREANERIEKLLKPEVPAVAV